MLRLPPMQSLPGTALRYASLSDAKHDVLSRRDLVRLAASPRECVARVTGGAALMGDDQGPDVGRFLADALGGSTCDIAVIAGATMAIDRPTPSECRDCDIYRVHCPRHGFGHIEPKPGVMEVLMHLAALKAPARTIGIVPTVSDSSLYGGFIVVDNDPDKDHYTVVDARCTFALMLQFSTDRPKLTWDHEWKVCLEYMELLRNEARHRSLHLVFNGGEVTRRECLHVAALAQQDNPWNLLLVEDSGRTATTLANDTEFRKEHRHVISCRKDELATVIRQLGFAPPQGIGE